VSNPAQALTDAMRAALLAHAPLGALLGGGHVHEERPRGGREPMVLFETIETRDWSTADQKAHEHFVGLAVRTNSRSRRLAQQILDEIEAVLDSAGLSLDGHRLVNLRIVFWSVVRQGETFGATLRLRAATEPI
jgi:ribosomal protein S18 acetylase RimI-like enzyme